MALKGGGALLLLLDEGALVKIRINIFLTWNRWIVISVILSGFEYHLRICSLSQFVIFYDITGFEKRGILQIISIFHQLGDIWFFKGIICKIHIGFRPQFVVAPLIWHKLIFRIFQIHHPT